MLRVSALAVTLGLALAAAAPAVSADQPRASAARACGTFVDFAQEGAFVQITRFAVTAKRLRCRRARRIVLALKRHGRVPDGFQCGSTHFEGGCVRGRREALYRAVREAEHQCPASGGLRGQAGVSDIHAHRLRCERARNLLERWVDAGKPASGPEPLSCESFTLEDSMVFMCRRRGRLMWFRVET
jgi:hypothetical protein